MHNKTMSTYQQVIANKVQEVSMFIAIEFFVFIPSSANWVRITKAVQCSGEFEVQPNSEVNYIFTILQQEFDIQTLDTCMSCVSIDQLNIKSIRKDQPDLFLYFGTNILQCVHTSCNRFNYR